MRNSRHSKLSQWTMLLPLAIAAAVLGCDRTGSAGTSHTARRHEVTIEGFRFQPAELRVNAGDTVAFINRDFVPHTATSGDAWDTGKLEANASGFVVARSQGEQSYTCTYHSNMQGKLAVE
jgi:plastocyanin